MLDGRQCGGRAGSLCLRVERHLRSAWRGTTDDTILFAEIAWKECREHR